MMNVLAVLRILLLNLVFLFLKKKWTSGRRTRYRFLNSLLHALISLCRKSGVFCMELQYASDVCHSRHS